MSFILYTIIIIYSRYKSKKKSLSQPHIHTFNLKPETLSPKKTQNNVSLGKTETMSPKKERRLTRRQIVFTTGTQDNSSSQSTYQSFNAHPRYHSQCKFSLKSTTTGRYSRRRTHRHVGRSKHAKVGMKNPRRVVATSISFDCFGQVHRLRPPPTGTAENRVESTRRSR